MKHRRDVPQIDPSFPGIPGRLDVERPAPSPASDPFLWSNYMLHQRALIEAHRAPAAAVKASYQLRRRSLVASLRLEHCGELWLERSNSEGYSWDVARCRSRWCPSCQNVWRGGQIEAYGRAIQPGDRVTLITLTGGPTVPRSGLLERLEGMTRAFRRWRRKVRDDVQGGVYAWEVTEDPVDGHLHCHIHAAVILVPGRWWLREDDAAVESSGRRGETTSALGWLAVTWAEALSKEAPSIYASLPVWRELLPSMREFIRRRFPEYWYVDRETGREEPTIARGAVCDIGGRWPRPDLNGTPLERLGGGDAREVLEQVVKYIVKDGGNVSVEGWKAIFRAFAGRRRIQPFGRLFGVKVEEPDEEAPEDPRELTGAAALIHAGAREPYSLEAAGFIVGAFVWGAEVVGSSEGGNRTIRWLKVRPRQQRKGRT